MLVNLERPILPIVSFEGETSFTEIALTIVSEMETTLNECDWETVTPKELKTLSRVLLRNIQRLKKLEGTTSVFNKDIIQAEIILEDKLNQLSHYLNSALLELKSAFCIMRPTSGTILL